MRSGRRRRPRSRPPVARELLRRLVSWEGLLLAILAVIVVVTGLAVPGYLNPQNQINLLELSVEKAIVVLAMTFVIVSGEIDLSIASVMGLSAVLVAWLKEQGVPLEVGIVAALLQSPGFGPSASVVGSSPEVARFSGVRVRRVKLAVFAMSGVVSAFAGVLLLARLGAVRGSTAEGFELDIITMVLLGGVSIFGGSGTMAGVILSILVVLNLRNGLALANATGNTQAGVIGALLILSVLVPNLVAATRSRRRRGGSVDATVMPNL